MADKPIIFAMANPDPEITPEEVAEVRDDAIVATGRSDYPNQINNVLGFPYIFRGALDVQARTINEPMKIAAAHAIAELARADVPDAVAKVYGRRLRYGRDYIIPAPFDPRLISAVPMAVAKAAMDLGVARRPIIDMEGYKSRLSARLDPAAGFINSIFDALRMRPKRVVFAEGEEEQVVRAASSFADLKLGHPILIGREAKVRHAFHLSGVNNPDSFEIVNAAYFGAQQGLCGVPVSALAAEGLPVPGLRAARELRPEHLRRLHAGARPCGCDGDGRHQKLDDGASRCAARARSEGGAAGHRRIRHHQPRQGHLRCGHVHSRYAHLGRACRYRRRGSGCCLALRDHAAGGDARPIRPSAIRRTSARSVSGRPLRILDQRGADFEYDGEMGADVALNRRAMAAYPFCRLTGTANVLVMPAFHAASISTKMLQELGGGTVIGPMLVGLSKPVQIASLGSSDSDLVNMAALSAFDVTG